MIRKVRAWALAASMAATLLVAAPAPQARAAAAFQVNSLTFTKAGDIAIGDGVCADATGKCTLRAALEEANYAGNATVTVATGFSGTINATTAVADWMHYATLSQGSLGAFYRIAGNGVTLDLDNRISVATAADNGSTAIYVSGSNVTVKNVKNAFGGEDAFQVSGSSVTLTGLSLTQQSNYFSERAVVVRTGAKDLTVSDSTFSGFFGGALAGDGVIQVDNAATVSGISIVDNKFTNGTGTACGLSAADGCRRSGISSGSNATIDGLSIKSNQFSGHDVLGSAPIRFHGSTGLKMSNLDISDNEFLDQATQGADGAYDGGTISLPTSAALSGENRIQGNRFVSRTSAGTSQTAFAVVWYGGTGGASNNTDSHLSISDNSFDGYSRYGSASTSAIRLYLTGIVTVERNTFGANSVAVTDSVSETSINAGLFTNYSNASNRKIGTWYPSKTAVMVGACTVQVTVASSTFSSSFQEPHYPARLDFYYTAGAGRGAEKLLGSKTVSANPSGQTFELPSTDHAAGTIRIQSQGNVGQATRAESSQYSRQLAVVKSSCGPTLTLNQAADQADPTYERMVHFVVTASKALAASGAGALAVADFSTSGSTAPGVVVTKLTARDSTTYDVWAKANDSGKIALSIPAGAVTDADGTVGPASTSTDNVVEYRNPLSVSPTSLMVYEGQPAKAVTVERVSSLVPTSTVTISATPDNSWVKATGTSLAAGGAATSSVMIASADDLGGQQRSAKVQLTVSSADPNFDGLTLSTVAVTAQKISLAITKLAWSDAAHKVSLPTGSVVRDGQTVYWTYVVVNTGNVALSGVAVTDAQLPKASFPSGVVCSNQTIAIGGQITCSAQAAVHPN